MRRAARASSRPSIKPSVQASQLLFRNAEGDYRPDPDAARFPAWQAPQKAPEAAQETITVAALFDRWAAYSADKKPPNTINCYRGSFRSLIAFVKDRDIRSLTQDDLYAWANHRKDVEEVHASAINRNDLVAASSVFAWAVGLHGGKLLPSNPVAGVSLEEPKQVAKRERTFRDAEVTAILTAASSVQPDERNPTFAAARRWCPWLAAYSGARIAELAHLEKRYAELPVVGRARRHVSRCAALREEPRVPGIDRHDEAGGEPFHVEADRPTVGNEMRPGENLLDLLPEEPFGTALKAGAHWIDQRASLVEWPAEQQQSIW